MKQDDGFEMIAKDVFHGWCAVCFCDECRKKGKSIKVELLNKMSYALRQVSKEAYEKASKELRASFVKFLTVDSDHSDKRKKDYNQAIFMKSDEEYFDGKQVFNGTDLYMVLEKFDKAVNEFKKDGDE